MPVTYIIDHSQRTVFTSVKGTVTVEEMKEYLINLGKDISFNPSYANLTDFTNTTPFDAKGSDIQDLARLTPFGTGSRRAFVVDQQLHYGFSRMAQVFEESKNVQIKIFTKYSEALEWLGVHEPDSIERGKL